MHTYDDPEVKAVRQHRMPKAEGTNADVSRSVDPGDADARSMLELQRLAGNASVSRLVAREAAEEQDDAGGRSPVLDVVGRGGGEPLAPELQTEMEGRLGAEFGDVRIHRDTAASSSARAVDAHAYTVGSDVVFRSDRWDPASTEGKRTLAHELTHVVQQAAGPVSGAPAPGGIRVSDPNDEFEQAASRSANLALAQPNPSPAAPAAAGIAAQLEAAPGTKEPDKEELEEDETMQGEWVQREAVKIPGDELAAESGPT